MDQIVHLSFSVFFTWPCSRIMLNKVLMEKDNGTKNEQQLGYAPETLRERMELLVGYLVELRGQGVTVSGEEAQMIKGWLEKEPDFPGLLAIVDEVASRYFAQKTLSGRGRSIFGLNKRIIKAIDQQSIG